MQAARRRPLFYAAIVLSLVILIAHHSPPPLGDLFDRILSNDVCRLVLENPKPVFLGGQIVSGAETRTSQYGDRFTNFTLKVGRVWVDGDKTGRIFAGLTKCYLKNLPEALRYGDEIVVQGSL